MSRRTLLQCHLVTGKAGRSNILARKSVQFSKTTTNFKYTPKGSRNNAQTSSFIFRVALFIIVGPVAGRFARRLREYNHGRDGKLCDASNSTQGFHRSGVYPRYSVRAILRGTKQGLLQGGRA